MSRELFLAGLSVVDVTGVLCVFVVATRPDLAISTMVFSTPRFTGQAGKKPSNYNPVGVNIGYRNKCPKSVKVQLSQNTLIGMPSSSSRSSRTGISVLPSPFDVC